MNQRMSGLKSLLTKPKSILFLLIAVLAFAGSMLIHYAWVRSMEISTEQALKLAISAEAGFQKAEIAKLEAVPEDINKPEYKAIKESLVQLGKIDNDVRFAYIYKQKNGKIFFIADSEPPESPDYSPPGQELTEATETTLQPFLDGKPLVSSEFTDRWGTWISVLVPMKEYDSGKVIAVFGFDYPLDNWYSSAIQNMLQAFLLTACLFMLLFAFYFILINRQKIIEKEELFRTIFEQSPMGIAIGDSSRAISNFNPRFAKITGISNENLDSIHIAQLSPLSDSSKILSTENESSMGIRFPSKQYIRPDGSVIWIDLTVAPIQFAHKSNVNHIYIVEDISERIRAEQNLQESERSKAVFLSNMPGMAYRCKNDKQWTMLFVSEGCYGLTGYPPESLLQSSVLSYNDLIVPEFREDVWNRWEGALREKSIFKYEYQIISASGEIKWVYEQGQGVFDLSGQVIALEGLIIDITEQKNKEKQIYYLSYHDVLTGLYTRRWLDSEVDRLEQEGSFPVSVIIGDINGLKLVNDAFGHAEGNKLIVEAANILRNCCRPGDVLSRTGGDEFTMLLPNTDKETAYEIFKEIRKSCEAFNSSDSARFTQLSLSLGFDTNTEKDQTIIETIRSAEAYLTRHKLLEQKSSHSAIISSIKRTMYERSRNTEEHSERLVSLSVSIGAALQLSHEMMDKLQLLAILHDIGKIGIHDKILNKPGKLTNSEWEQMKRHPEIGYRIAMSSPELMSISNYILSHQERYDGTGYPEGLKGEEIPLLSRILSVVDAYDAMTSDRSYRKAMSREAALSEILRCSGKQFDPAIVDIFARLIDEETAI